MVKSLENIIDKGDYSIELLNEIASDIKKLSTYSSNLSLKLAQISAKLSRANEYGLNVLNYERKFIDFRKVVFLRSIKMYIDAFQTNLDNIGISLDDIKNEHKLLVNYIKETNSLSDSKKISYLKEITNNFNSFSDNIKVSILKKKILSIKNNKNSNISGLEKITEELIKLKDNGIKIDELTSLILD